MVRRRHKPKRYPIAAGDSPPAPTTDLQKRAKALARVARLASLASPPGEPTPEQAGKFIYETKRIKDPKSPHPRLVRYNTTGQAIDRYKARGLISERQHNAATRYRAEFDRQGLTQSLVSNYEPGGGSGSSSPNYAGLLPSTAAGLDARRKWREARRALPQNLAARFDAIVIDETDAKEVAEGAGRTGQLGSTYALEWLRIGCDELVDHYRF